MQGISNHNMVEKVAINGHSRNLSQCTAGKVDTSSLSLSLNHNMGTRVGINSLNLSLSHTGQRVDTSNLSTNLHSSNSLKVEKAGRVALNSMSSKTHLVRMPTMIGQESPSLHSVDRWVVSVLSEDTKSSLEPFFVQLV
jgi:hypothetical protein